MTKEPRTCLVEEGAVMKQSSVTDIIALDTTDTKAFHPLRKSDIEPKPE